MKPQRESMNGETKRTKKRRFLYTSDSTSKLVRGKSYLVVDKYDKLSSQRDVKKMEQKASSSQVKVGSTQNYRKLNMLHVTITLLCQNKRIS